MEYAQFVPAPGPVIDQAAHEHESLDRRVIRAWVSAARNSRAAAVPEPSSMAASTAIPTPSSGLDKIAPSAPSEDFPGPNVRNLPEALPICYRSVGAEAIGPMPRNGTTHGVRREVSPNCRHVIRVPSG